MTLLRSIAIYFVTFLWALVFWSMMLVPMIIAGCLPAERRRHWVRVMLLKFGRGTVRVMWRPFFKVDYLDRTGGIREPGIVVANHRSAIDAFLVSMPDLSMAQTVNDWPFRVPILGWVAKMAGYLNITNWDYETLNARSRSVLGIGDMIVSYPEGTRSESPKMNPFRSGAFRVAMDMKLPVYMLCIAGDQFMPDRKFRFREFRDLKVHFLGPIPADEVQRYATAYALKMKVFRIMTEELASMDAELENERQL
ncbi:MAG: 1-acyl-sn-glycerol-3-phosphate acyltransferase [Lentisphaeria bacterium]|nr:1-acyl-sn-glycerol-3-phosphate acyltransferase [Lentisphaeria bacterium]